MTEYVPVTPYMAEWCKGNILGSYPRASGSSPDSATRKDIGNLVLIYESNVFNKSYYSILLFVLLEFFYIIQMLEYCAKSESGFYPQTIVSSFR